jgi:hypothetical protein
MLHIENSRGKGEPQRSDEGVVELAGIKPFA